MSNEGEFTGKVRKGETLDESWRDYDRAGN